MPGSPARGGGNPRERVDRSADRCADWPCREQSEATLAAHRQAPLGGRMGQSKAPERSGGALRCPAGGKTRRPRSRAENAQRLQRRGGAYHCACLFACLLLTALLP
jgi:hypothetical protein